MKKLLLLAAALTVTAILPSLRAQTTATPVPVQTDDTWRFGASLYVYAPTISGSTSLPVSGGGNVGGPTESLISKLDGAFMGSFAVHQGRYGAFTDILYVSFSDTKAGTRDFTVGGVGIPVGVTANTDASLKGWLWTLAGDYQVNEDAGSPVFVFGGARMLSLDASMSWQLAGALGPIPLPDQAGNVSGSQTNWDAIIGFRGRVALGDSKHWFVPYYFDIGTGQSSSTYQMLAGVGYAFSACDVDLGWRFLKYNLKSGSKVDSLSLSGLQLGVVFRW